MKLTSPIAKRRTRIEIIPLIDIIFFLLATFVMVSMSMIKNHGIPVALPGAVSGVAQPEGEARVVSMTEGGQLYLDQQPVTDEELGARLAAAKAQDPEVRVFIHGDERAQFGWAVEVLDRVRRAGVTKVSIRTAPMPMAADAS
jgi:biopolymer transport protein ExbD